MQALHIAPQQVTSALQTANINLPGGAVEDNGNVYAGCRTGVSCSVAGGENPPATCLTLSSFRQHSFMVLA